MLSDPRERPEPNTPRGSTAEWPWRFVVAAVLFLVVLAPLVPDEPLHLSGVSVVVGLACAALAILSGIASALRAEPSDRRSGWLAAACGLVLGLGWLAWWVIKLMSELS
jgi:hypothetical protein